MISMIGKDLWRSCVAIIDLSDKPRNNATLCYLIHSCSQNNRSTDENSLPDKCN